MSGHGPTPVASSGRSSRRRNSGRDLTLLEQANPTIPEMPGGRWHPATRNWWRSVFASPVAAEYLHHDAEIVRSTLELVERYYRVGELDDPAAASVAIRLSAEIRRREAQLSLGPAERLRQRIRVVKADVAELKRPRPQRAEGEADPRDLLTGL